MNTNATVYLVRRGRQSRAGKRVESFYLKWHGGSESLGRCDQVTKREAQALRRKKERELGTGKAPLRRPTLTNN